MPDLWVDVDTAVIVPVNVMPLIDDTDFKTIEIAVVYNSTGMALTWNFVTCAGVVTGVAVTPTTVGVYDWAEPVADKGMYAIEIPASGGASANNDTEGVGWFTGVATGVLPWRGPTIGFRRAALNDLFIDGGTASTNLEDFFDGTGYVGGTAKLTVDLNKILGATLTETVGGYLTAAFKKLFDVATPVLVASDVMRGTDSAALASVCMETRLSELDAGTPGKAAAEIDLIKTDAAAILVDTGTTLDGRIPAALVGGKMDASVGAVAVGVDLSATMAATVKTQAVAALNTDTYAEPVQGSPAATTTLAAKINYLFKAWRNRNTQTASQYSLYGDDAITVDHKGTFSDNGVTADRGEIISGL